MITLVTTGVLFHRHALPATTRHYVFGGESCCLIVCCRSRRSCTFYFLINKLVHIELFPRHCVFGGGGGNRVLSVCCRSRRNCTFYFLINKLMHTDLYACDSLVDGGCGHYPAFTQSIAMFTSKCFHQWGQTLTNFLSFLRSASTGTFIKRKEIYSSQWLRSLVNSAVSRD